MDLLEEKYKFKNPTVLFLILILSFETNIETVFGSVTNTPSWGPISLKLVAACGTEAKLEWQQENQYAAQNLSALKCELTYSLSGKSPLEIVDIYLEQHTHTLTLYNLSKGENYSVFMACDDTVIKTKAVSFISGALCDHSSSHVNVSDSEDSKLVSTYAHTSSYDTIEWPIAIAFALVGLIICAVVAFYMWKKYQRRQRILRIFRQGQNDPFQALYSPTQDSYSF